MHDRLFVPVYILRIVPTDMSAALWHTYIFRVFWLNPGRGLSAFNGRFGTGGRDGCGWTIGQAAAGDWEPGQVG